METVLLAALPSLLVGVMLALFNRRQTKRDKAVDTRAEARKQESLLNMKLVMANGKLTYAVAMAIKRGKPNGEVEEGVDAYDEARRDYLNFLNAQATDHLVG